MINIFYIMTAPGDSGTYIDELSTCLSKEKDVCIFKVYLHHTESKELKIHPKNNITSIYIPENITKVIDEKYYQRAAQIIFIQFKSIESIVLHVNSKEQVHFSREFKRLFKCPILYTVHSLEDGGPHLKKTTNGQILNIADQVICTTNRIKSSLIKYYNISSGKLNVIYNGLEVPSEISETKAELKKRYGFSPKDQIILYSGNLRDCSNIDKLIEAFVMIKDKNPSAKLIIEGTGEYNQYLSLASNCIGRIIFTGKLVKEKLYNFYHLSSIGVVLTQHDRYQYTLLEMMQSKLPVIICDLPVLNELVLHKKTGLCCKTKLLNNKSEEEATNINDLVIQLNYLLNHPSERKKLLENAYNSVLDYHSIENMGYKTFSIYKKLAGVK